MDGQRVNESRDNHAAYRLSLCVLDDGSAYRYELVGPGRDTSVLDAETTMLHFPTDLFAQGTPYAHLPSSNGRQSIL